MQLLDFDSITERFRQTSTLPPLPRSAMALIEAVDSEEATVFDLERIISADPALSLAILRAATTDPFERCTTLRHAVMKVGQNGVRALGISLAVRALSKDLSVEGFCPVRFARHSLASGFLARYIFLKRGHQEAFETGLSAEEVFAAGVIHDLGIGLLAHLLPDMFTKTVNYSMHSGLTIEDAFENISGGTVYELGALAAETWNLPPLFSQTMRSLNSPEDRHGEFIATYCIAYGDHLAGTFGDSIETWECARPLDPMVEAEVGLEEEEIEELREIIDRHLEAFLSPQAVAC